MNPNEQHEHQFPEANIDGTLVAYPCLLCGLSAGDALKQAAEDRASFEADITRDVEVIRELEDMMNDVPRRNRLDKNVPAELAIYEAMQVVERMDADVRLTDAVILLGAARECVADFIDNKPVRRVHVRMSVGVEPPTNG